MNGYIGSKIIVATPRKKTHHSRGPHPVTMLVQYSHCLFCDYINHITKSIGQSMYTNNHNSMFEATYYMYVYC